MNHNFVFEVATICLVTHLLFAEMDTSRHVSRHVFQKSRIVSVSVSDHCVSTLGRDIAAI